MPPISPIKILGNLKFFSHSLKLPVSFQKPQGDPKGKQYGDAFKKPDDMIAIPQVIPPWFMPAEIPNKYYQDQCDKIGNGFKELHDSMIDAVQFAHNMWKLQAKFQNLQVMAVSAIGSPGCLDGPELESLIKNAPMCAAFTGNKGKYRDAVAAGVSKCFKNWQGQVTVPGLPWYPAFAAFPGPMAPPMPNIPVPLIACISAKMTDIVMPDTMKSEMVSALDGGLKDKDKDKQHEALFDAIATVLALAFLMWLPQQMVMLVLGKGPIPTFAPPFVPVGPVVGGDNIAAPGHLMA
jgi:hypothetical protein